MMPYGVVYRTVGENATFFANRTPAADAKLARCERVEGAFDERHAADTVSVAWLEPRMLIQCGQIAAQDHEGTFLCETHMAWWFCQICETQLPEFAPYTACASCLAT